MSLSIHLTSCGLLASLTAAKSQVSKPHVLLMVADDYGYNDVGYNQNTKMPINPEGKHTTNPDQVIKTPHIDQLARDGVILTNYYVQPVCSPTRGTIMSGRYPSHTGIGPNVIRPTAPYGLPLDETTIAEVMQGAGYRTSAIGKWHLGFCTEEYTPTFRGFDSYQGYLLGAEDYYKHTRSFHEHEGYDLRNSSMESPKELPPTAKSFKGVYSTDIFTQRGIDLAHYHAAHYPSTPFFLYFAYQAVHAPLQPPRHYTENSPYTNITNDSRHRYALMTTAMDDGVSKVVQGWKDAGIWNDTVMIFTTDNGGQVEPKHGGGNNFPLRGYKAHAYEGGIRGVGFVRGTNNPSLAPLPAGTMSRALMHSTDWLPTVAALAGVTEVHTTNPLDGFNAWPALQGTTANTSRKYLVHNCPAESDGLGGAFRMGDYKLMYVSADGTTNGQYAMQVDASMTQYLPAGLESSDLVCPPPKAAYGVSSDVPATLGVFLFNVMSDPYECTNLAGLSEYASELATLVNTFAAYQSGTNTVPDTSLKVGNYSSGSNPKHLPDGAWGPFLNGCQ